MHQLKKPKQNTLYNVFKNTHRVLQIAEVVSGVKVHCFSNMKLIEQVVKLQVYFAWNSIDTANLQTCESRSHSYVNKL